MSDIETLTGKLIEWGTRKVMVLADSNVAALYPHYFESLSASFECRTMEIPAGEDCKNMDQLARIWEQMLAFGLGRSDVLISFGGGSICDVGGFAAATFKRGVHAVNCPTTLLAMIDAAHGGKTAVNLHHVKNCVGVVRQPDYVMPANLDFLKTLPVAELKSGFGEMVKYALIASPELFEQLCGVETLTAEAIQPEWIQACVRFKDEVVKKDPEDHKERHVLNFGHTFGHAIESCYLSAGQCITHGEAVAIGMVYESRLSEELTGLPHHQFIQIHNFILKHFNIPELSEDGLNRLLPFLKQDKKNSQDRINFTLLEGIGKPIIDNFVQKESLIKALSIC